DQNTDKTLERTEDRAVQHNGRLTRSIFRHKLGVQTGWHRKVHLNGSALPNPAYAILQRELDFRTVKRTLSRQQLPSQAFRIQSISQCFLGFIPDFITAYALFRARGN